MGYAYLFGPVNSSRLGLSLGLDLLGDTICSLDCTYCEVGKTTRLTCQRKPYVRAADILSELEQWSNGASRLPDHITLGGSGEPCLNSEMGAVIDGIKTIFPDTPVAVLTNSTLLHDPAVRGELARADVVLPSLDSLVPSEMRRLNRPHEDIDIDVLRQGLVDFAAGYDGRIYLEVLLVAGINDTEENLTLLTDFVREFRPDRVDVTTMSRPGTARSAQPVDAQLLTRFREALTPLAKPSEAERLFLSSRMGGPTTISTESATDERADNAPTQDADTALQEKRDVRERIHGSIKRRPQTARQLSQALDLPLGLVQETLDNLVTDGTTGRGEKDGDTYYGVFWG